MSSKTYPPFKPSYQTLCISLLSHACHMHCLPHPTSHPAGVSLTQKETTEYNDVTVNDKKAHAFLSSTSEGKWSVSHLGHFTPKERGPPPSQTHSIMMLNGCQCYPRSFRKNLELNYNSLVIQPTAK